MDPVGDLLLSMPMHAEASSTRQMTVLDLLCMFVVVLFAIALGVNYLSLKLGVFLCFLGLPLVQWRLPHRFGLPRWVRCLTLRRVVVNSSFLVGIR